MTKLDEKYMLNIILRLLNNYSDRIKLLENRSELLETSDNTPFSIIYTGDSTTPWHFERQMLPIKDINKTKPILCYFQPTTSSEGFLCFAWPTNFSDNLIQTTAKGTLFAKFVIGQIDGFLRYIDQKEDPQFLGGKAPSSSSDWPPNNITLSNRNEPANFTQDQNMPPEDGAIWWGYGYGDKDSSTSPAWPSHPNPKAQAPPPECKCHAYFYSRS